MKLMSFFAAGLVALTGLAPVVVAAPASAQERVVVRERTVVTSRRGYHRPRTRRVCSVRYRHGERIRTCRTVRRR